jgi:hypothetical protein
MLKYVEDLKRGSNAEFGPKDYFEIASKKKAAGFKPTALKRKPWVSFFVYPWFLTSWFFLPCRPMDRLPKKEATQKTKKTKVEKPKPHLLCPIN